MGEETPLSTLKDLDFALHINPKTNAMDFDRMVEDAFRGMFLGNAEKRSAVTNTVQKLAHLVEYNRLMDKLREKLCSLTSEENNQLTQLARNNKWPMPSD